MKMPSLFIGHGNPMNALANNAFTKTLEAEGARLMELNPEAILVVSAHWLTYGTYVTVSPHPETIHDFSGFPEELFRVVYPAPGSPASAAETIDVVKMIDIKEDSEWGLDHGTWSILRHMFPLANIPVYQLSIDYKKPPLYHFNLANELKTLRDKGIIIIGSGNIVHNLLLIDFNEDAAPFGWAIEYDDLIKSFLLSKDYSALLDYTKFGNAYLAVPTPDHYYPMIYTLGASDKNEELKFIYEEIQNASISMRSFRIG
jgi:4,5-DOPA dioxygenase extradiol